MDSAILRILAESFPNYRDIIPLCRESRDILKGTIGMLPFYPAAYERSSALIQKNFLKFIAAKNPFPVYVPTAAPDTRCAVEVARHNCRGSAEAAMEACKEAVSAIQRFHHLLAELRALSLNSGELQLSADKASLKCCAAFDAIIAHAEEYLRIESLCPGGDH